MMNWIVSTSLRLRVLVLAASVVLMIAGVRAAQQAPMDVFPEFAPPLVEIQTEAPGLSTEEVESLVSVPLENALNGTIGLKTIRSKSVLGLSSVVLILKEGTDLMAARQVVQERLSVEGPRLPAVAIRNGVPLKLGDVADVKIGFPPPIGDAVINDGPGLLLIVEKQPTGNTLEVTRNVEKALKDLEPGLKDVELDPTIFRPAGF